PRDRTVATPPTWGGTFRGCTSPESWHPGARGLRSLPCRTGSIHYTEEDRMGDRDELRREGVEDSIEGKTNDLKGRLKDAADGLTGDTSVQAEGKLDRAKGKVQDTIGKAKRAISDELDEPNP